MQACLSINVGTLSVTELAPIKCPECLGLFNPRIAPALACDLFTSEQRAAAPWIGDFALVQGAIGADLSSGVFREFFGVGLGGVFKIAQRHCLWVFFAQLRLGLGLSGCGKRGAACRDGHHEGAS